MLTEIKYINWYEKEKENMIRNKELGMEPVFLFDIPIDSKGVIINDYSHWVFSPNNWNGGDAIRYYLNDNWGKVVVNGFDIKWYYVEENEQYHVFIFGDAKFYEITWCVHSGKTDYIRINGNLISLTEYIELCNILGVEYFAMEVVANDFMAQISY